MRHIWIASHSPRYLFSVFNWPVSVLPCISEHSSVSHNHQGELNWLLFFKTQSLQGICTLQTLIFLRFLNGIFTRVFLAYRMKWFLEVKYGRIFSTYFSLSVPHNICLPPECCNLGSSPKFLCSRYTFVCEPLEFCCPSPKHHVENRLNHHYLSFSRCKHLWQLTWTSITF